jgi:hypothetical protein
MPRGKARSKIWDGTDWDDGFWSEGRLWVYRPDYPNLSEKSNYALRSRIVWWLSGRPIPQKGYVIHHINGDPSDDRLENLKIMSKGKHTTLHTKKKHIELMCRQCGKSFSVPMWKIRGRVKEGRGTVKFCSRKCFYESGVAILGRKNISDAVRKEYEKRSVK